MNYQDFVAGKLVHSLPTGMESTDSDWPHLFDFQKDLVRWALRRGRAAVFSATGTGKSRMEVTWAHEISLYTDRPTLILCPLAVATQTAAEGARLGIQVTICKTAADVRPGVNICNYEKLHLLEPSAFGGVAFDESSCVKHYNSKTLAQLMAAFGRTAFRLSATATPSPNDFTELGTQCELLGICSRVEMLSEYFVHDGGETQKWRLKGHARKAFWKFVASWAALVRSPADLGYDANAYELPPLTIEHHVIAADEQAVREAGWLFAQPANSLMERKAARRGSIAGRVEQTAALVNSDAEPWVVWCALNAESDALADAIPGSVEVRGSMTTEEKESALEAFSTGRARVVISKASITGWGLNWQHCNRMAFVGVDDSWESYHQAVRRCYRFGQKRPVQVHVFASELEGAVVANLQRKEADALTMAAELAAETADVVRSAVRGAVSGVNVYEAAVRMRLPQWLMTESEARG